MTQTHIKRNAAILLAMITLIAAVLIFIFSVGASLAYIGSYGGIFEPIVSIVSALILALIGMELAEYSATLK